MSYWIYKQFGRVISEKEIHAKIDKWIAPWYLKPYYSFIEWNEKRKRYNSAEIKLKSDNPWNGCFINLVTYLFYFVIIIMFILLIFI
jgi:hypothetical protein